MRSKGEERKVLYCHLKELQLEFEWNWIGKELTESSVCASVLRCALRTTDTAVIYAIASGDRCARARVRSTGERQSASERRDAAGR